MATKTFNVRIKNRYDSYTNWSTANPVLEVGEIALTAVVQGDNQSQLNPTVLAKIGDGSTHYNDLKFLSATASDVYGWAKAATKPTYTANEISGLADFISGEIQDTDTQYRITTTDNVTYKLQSTLAPVTESSTWTDVSTFKATTVEAGSTAGTIKVNGTDMAINGFSELSTQVTTNKNDIATLKGDVNTEGSVAKAVADGDKAVKEALETEINAKISSTYKPAGSLAAAGLTTDLLNEANNGKVYNITDALTTTDNFVEGAGKSYPAGTNVVVINTGTDEAPSYKFDVLAGFVDLSSYATTDAVNKAIEDTLKDPANLPSEIPTDKIKDFDPEAVSAVDTALNTENSTIKTTVKEIADASATAKIGDLDVEDSAVTGEVVTAVSETDGKISVTRGTVDIAHLAQETGDEIIFNCGGAGAGTAV